MDRLTLISVEKDLYDFYAATARQVKGYTPEMLMADALVLYAGMVSKTIASQQKSEAQIPDTFSSKSSASRSR